MRITVTATAAGGWTHEFIYPRSDPETRDKRAIANAAVDLVASADEPPACETVSFTVRRQPENAP